MFDTEICLLATKSKQKVQNFCVYYLNTNNKNICRFLSFFTILALI